ncbi:N-acetyl-alpha-glucosaminidase [Lasioglossum baleicum]|uniref:N-acetyl-alpha-glucosaminidase n=1 Tax=Lasioglossum baleicum TaxID=434251 RepID=UPI003FCE55A0
MMSISLQTYAVSVMTVARMSTCQLSLLILGLLAVLAEPNEKADSFEHTLGHLRTRSTPEEQAEAARGVAERLLGVDQAKLFSLHVNPSFRRYGKDMFAIDKDPNHNIIEIMATSGVAATWGLHYYLKHFCHAHVSWEGSQLELPDLLPDVHMRLTSNDRFRYYQNVCSFGYSSVWWTWEQWERNIDWMALNGINLALAFNGQEAIWYSVYTGLNLTKTEIDEHFAGPAFLPWARMGNMRGFGGGLPPVWMDSSMNLQQRILERMRSLGIIPVLPAFSGHVPRAFKRLFPEANMTKSSVWNHFGDKYCCPYLLAPTDPLFQKVGKLFLETYIAAFGTDHVYNCDTFNENEPETGELRYLRDIGRSVFDAMVQVDPKAIWLMQGWLFVHDRPFWTTPRVKSFVTSVPIGRMIILDLQSEQFPQYNRFESYYGQPYIWCMLHNFGGTLGMFGSAGIINRRVFEARKMANSTMIGTGLTPEGINQNYVIYELMNEMAYRREPVDLDKWFANYATRRYGVENEWAALTWQLLGRTVYSFTGNRKMRGRYVITRRPSLKLTPWTWYNPDTVIRAVSTLMEARHELKNSTLYAHDFVDLYRQCLQLAADQVYVNLTTFYHPETVDDFKDSAKSMLTILDDLEHLLAHSKNFLLGTWLRDAKSHAINDIEEELYEYNARNQITLWGPRGEIRDYANKQWSGMFADYYKPRWAIFLESLDATLTKGEVLNITRINERMFNEVEKPFTFSRKIYPTEPLGDPIEAAMRVFSKWTGTGTGHRGRRVVELGGRRSNFVKIVNIDKRAFYRWIELQIETAKDKFEGRNGNSRSKERR